jgi:TatD DNase family protein
MTRDLHLQPKYMDIHGHPNFAVYKDDRQNVIERALSLGVWMNVVGTQRDTSRLALSVAKEYQSGVYATVGLHPIHTSRSFHDREELGEGGEEFTSRGEEFDYEYYKRLAMDQKVVAIGECGLDYFRLDTKAPNFEEMINRQKSAFVKQIELAIDVGKPLMLHLRSGSGFSAYREAYEIIKKYNLKGIKGNLHFFAGSWEEAELFLDLGFSFSFTGVITFTNSYYNVIRQLPMNRIMAETDCPYVSPIPYRGKRNEPSFIVSVVDKLAEIRGIDRDYAYQQLLSNSLNFFGIKA